MSFLHVAVIEEFEECFVSFSEDGLREQVSDFLIRRSIVPPNDMEWAVCVIAISDGNISIENPAAVNIISYYKVESKLGI